MVEKHFYKAFTLMYHDVAEFIGITTKENFYRLLFGSVYDHRKYSMDGDDSIRAITSGRNTIHRECAKTLRTTEGFELLRIAIETKFLPASKNKEHITIELITIINSDLNIPDSIKETIKNSIIDHTDYQFSRALAASLVCLDYSDFMVKSSKDRFMNTDFMRLTSDKPMPKYPQYMTDSADSAVNQLIGRENDLQNIRDEVIVHKHNLLISGVGGLGKTELVKEFITDIKNTETNVTEIEQIAWVPYDNHDIRLSIKQAFHMSCPLDEVWQEIQTIASECRHRLLLVIDNIEAPEDDPYLRKLSMLSCRLIVTSRQRKLSGFNHVFELQPLTIEKCRDLFYLHYEHQERDNELVNDIITLAAKLTIMVVFIAKAAFLESLSLRELYWKLVEKGFKLSEEDVSCEHEKLQNDETIIRQMCILFSLVSFSDTDKKVLTYISVIPNLQFSFEKAKEWFQIPKNSLLMHLFQAGMLEHTMDRRSHMYWMHSVIAAAVREQQKENLYDTVSPFIHELSENLELGEYWGKGYTKLDLIPFSWSVADIMENHWGNEDDATFLLRLFYVCYEASNYPICRQLIEKVLEIDKRINDIEMLIRDYKNYGEFLLRIDETELSLKQFDIAQQYMLQVDPEQKMTLEWAYLWHKYGNYYYHIGDPGQALDYYYKALELDMTIPDLSPRELATDYASIAEIYQEYGDLSGAYEMLTKAIETEGFIEEDSESIMLHYYMATLCSDFVSNGYEEYADEAELRFQKVIEFREKYSAKNSHDLADVYLEYAGYCKEISQFDKAECYCQKAEDIYRMLYGDDSYHVLQCICTKALILEEKGQLSDAIELYTGLIGKTEFMSNYPKTDLCRDYHNYANLLEYAGSYDDAEAYFQKAIELVKKVYAEDSPNLAQLYLDYTNCLMGMEEYSSAISYLNKLKQFTENDSLLERVMEHKIAACYGFMKDFSKAEVHLLKALELCTQNDNGVTDIGYIYVDLSHVSHHLVKESDAIKYANLAREISSQYPEDTELESYVHTLETILHEN